MKTYALSQQGISKVRQRFIRRTGTSLAVICCIITGINLWRAADNWLLALIISITLSVGVVAFVSSRALQQNKEVWESIRIELNDDTIARSQVRIPQMRMNREEITSIEETNEGLCIYTEDKLQELAIPIDLDPNDYQEIKTTLAARSNIQRKPQEGKTQNFAFYAILLIGFGVLFISTSLWIVLITGALLTGYDGYTYWIVRQTEGIDPKFKRSMLFAFLLPMFITAIRACSLSGGPQVWRGG